MFLPYDIVVLLILSPFIIVLWVVFMIVQVLLRIAFWLMKAALKLMIRITCLLFREFSR